MFILNFDTPQEACATVKVENKKKKKYHFHQSWDKPKIFHQLKHATTGEA
jgi:hypothetical protein